VSSSKETRTRVLVIAMANSVHTARWLSQFRNKAVDIVLFPSTPNRSLHPLIVDLLKNEDEMTLRIAPFMRKSAYPLGLLDIFLANNLRAIPLRKILKSREDFDVVHALELQHAGYLLLKVTRSIPSSARIIISNWGSDIYWFQRFRSHRQKLEKLMRVATHYSCECKRDIELAKKLGFNGNSFPVHPNAGSFSEETFQVARNSPPPSSRSLVMIKGYTGFVGRADIALDACRIASEALKNFKIVLYSSDVRSRRIAKRLARETGLDITTYRKHELSHEEMLELFRNARTYVGISESDGISTSLLDAISSGCFPIQTTTSCASEWVVDGVSGLLVDFRDVNGIASAIENALTGDEFVDNAAVKNLKIAQTRLSDQTIESDIHQFYKLT